MNHFVKNDGIELNDELDKLFNTADIQLIDGKFEFIIDSTHQSTFDDHIMGHVLTVLLQTTFVDKLEKLVIRAKFKIGPKLFKIFTESLTRKKCKICFDYQITPKRRTEWSNSSKNIRYDRVLTRFFNFRMSKANFPLKSVI